MICIVDGVLDEKADRPWMCVLISDVVVCSRLANTMISKFARGLNQSGQYF